MAHGRSLKNDFEQKSEEQKSKFPTLTFSNLSFLNTFNYFLFI